MIKRVSRDEEKMEEAAPLGGVDLKRAFSLLRLGEPAQEENQARLVVGYHEDEGMIGPEYGSLFKNAKSLRYTNSRRCRCFSSFLAHLQAAA